MKRPLVMFCARVAITAFAFWWISRLVDLDSLKKAFQSANLTWLLIATGCWFAAQIICTVRWSRLVPNHPTLKLPFLLNTYFVANFFNTFLPTTVGGDVIRGYDLIKVTGEWRGPLASILMDRLTGVVGFLTFAVAAFIAYPPAREDKVILFSFLALCAIVVAAISIIGSRKALQTLLVPFGKIGLGQLKSHAEQFHDSLIAYFKHPKRLGQAFAISLLVQIIAISIYAAVARALAIQVPILFLVLAVPIIIMVSQLPVSLGGWGLRELATIQLLARVGVDPAESLSLSIICGILPFTTGAVGALLFLARKQKKKPAKEKD